MGCVFGEDLEKVSLKIGLFLFCIIVKIVV